PIASRIAVAVPPRRMALIGATSSATGLTLISLLGFLTAESLSPPAALAVLMLASLLQGFGVGLFQVAYFDIATTTLPKENRG
ncbi:hypothetical protein, partial [Klebsiella pneumoniae]|uniref:hypothetical protein n=1 Tax=Klebsiella pneumoniae TaxID=573 RepID=UPI0019542461